MTMSPASPPRLSDRTFGFTMAGILCAISLVCWLFFDLRIIWLPTIGAALLLAALIAPISLLPLNRLWVRFGYLLSRINNYIVLGAFFFLILLPVGFLLRVIGRDALGRSIDGQADSYFKPVGTQTNEESLRNLF